MSGGKKKSFSSMIVWLLMALLILGLGGFGVSNFGGSIRSIGAVGEAEISVDAYFRALNQELAALESELGEPVPLSQATTFGLDRQVQAQLITNAALDNEASRIGLSVGDELVRRNLLAEPAFQGIDGTFDREGYRYALDQAGLTESQYEETIRAESARVLLQGAVISGVSAPKPILDAYSTYIGEQRDFTWLRLGVEALDSALPEPTDADLQAYYDANPADFTSPEARRITYAWLSPEMLIDTIDVPEAELRKLYDERIDQYRTEERRLVERLVFLDAAEAEAALARLTAGELSFDALVAERGLELADIDLGDVSQADLGGAGTGVFALSEPGVTGPLPSDLGPALFRMNAILPAQETSFDEARDELRDEFTMDRARRQIAGSINDIDDLLAGGATLEELAADTDMELGQIDWSEGAGDGIAGYEDFRAAALAVQQGDFPEVLTLDDGGIFALRLEEIIPPTLQPLDTVMQNVIAGWEVEETTKRLGEKADALIAELESDATMADLGLEPVVETGLVRSSFVQGLDPAVMIEVFAMTPGELRRFDSLASVVIVQLDAVNPPDPTSADYQAVTAALQQQVAQGLANDIFINFNGALQTQAGITLNPTAINAVHAQFP